MTGGLYLNEKNTITQYTNPIGDCKMTAYLINHLRQPGVVNSEVLDYLDQVQASLDSFGGKFKS